MIPKQAKLIVTICLVLFKCFISIYSSTIPKALSYKHKKKGEGKRIQIPTNWDHKLFLTFIFYLHSPLSLRRTTNNKRRQRHNLHCCSLSPVNLSQFLLLCQSLVRSISFVTTPVSPPHINVHLHTPSCTPCHRNLAQASLSNSRY